MFTRGEKLAIGIAAVEGLAYFVTLKAIQKYCGNRYLDKYNMTAGEYFDAVMSSKSVEEYNQKINR